MVGADIDYVVVESDVTGTTERYLLGEARLPAYARELGEDPVVVERLKGSDLAGRSYTPPFSYYAGHENAFRVVEAEFVTTTDGTGLVHTAGAFGEDDKVVTDREGIEPVMPVGKDGRFTFPVTEYEGMQVFDANLPIIDHLKAATRGEAAGSVSPGTVLLRRETYDHSYPHCWRCREPLIYKGVSSWFVEVTAVKERLLELNEEIRWVPDHIKHGQFGKWLENARDWSITRNRFWGSPVPVWKSDDPAYPRLDVYGSFEQLEADFGVTVTDLHRPYVDDLVRPNPDDPTGKSMMRRVPDVLDVWFDSGSMSFAQVHYPFENADWFEHHFPGDFITEYIGQTRGWFYTLHILAGAIFDRPAFKTSLSHGIVLGSDGQKMSQVAAQLPRRPRGLRPRRRRRDALVPDVVADPARRQPGRHRAGHPRLGAPGDDPAVEQLVLLRPLRQRLRERHRVRRAVVDGVHGPARPLPAGQVPAVRRGDDAPARQLRGRGGLRLDAVVPRRAHELVHPPLP